MANSSSNDDRAITIEVANSSADPDWKVSNESMNAVIELVTDICKRNGIKKLLWVNDMKLVGQIDKQNMTLHKWFGGKWINGVYYPSTACPGPYLEKNMGGIATAVNSRLNSSNQNGGDDEIYRVRKTWKDAASQVGAYNDYSLACKCADEHPGYYVFNSKGQKLYPSAQTSKNTGKQSSNTTVTSGTTKEFKVYVSSAVLNIRKGPGTNYARTGKFTGVGYFTIVEVKNGTGSKSGWGKLKSGAGWISLDYVKKV